MCVILNVYKTLNKESSDVQEKHGSSTFRPGKDKASYENALHELNELNALRREAKEKEIIWAVRRNGSSFQEVMRLIRL